MPQARPFCVCRGPAPNAASSHTDSPHIGVTPSKRGTEKVRSLQQGFITVRHSRPCYAAVHATLVRDCDRNYSTDTRNEERLKSVDSGSREPQKHPLSSNRAQAGTISSETITGAHNASCTASLLHGGEANEEKLKITHSEHLW
ncbi:unnamed protein product, partial [Rangifer tarandus platyrhynchus]